MQNFNASQGYPYVTNPNGAHNLSTNCSNSFTYVKQDLNHLAAVPKTTVLINPHFGKKVFINPNFQVPQAQKPVEHNLDNLSSSLPRRNLHVNPASLPKTTESSNVPLNCANTPRSNVHVNPANLPKSSNQCSKIHINPNCLLKTTTSPKRLNVHINPNILKLRNAEAHKKQQRDQDFGSANVPQDNKTVYKSATKIIRQQNSINIKNYKELQVSENLRVQDVTRKRRPSIRSKYRIVKSTVLEKTVSDTPKKIKSQIKSKYKLVKAKPPSPLIKSQILRIKKSQHIFKLDNRNLKENIPAQDRTKQFVYRNKLMTTSELAKIMPLRQKKDLSLVNIRGIMYNKSHNSLQRSAPLKKSKKTTWDVQRKSILKSKYKLVRKSLVIKSPLKGCKKIITKVWDIKSKVHVTANGKLRKCNIPCPYYRKFGKCKGKDNGKCFRKHDPGQIALCTKFLQGACVDEKCLLSHNVSSEKMPTCKFYLEGICSKENCPYLHVRISPKADICRDFLEGYCIMASKCLKRHQLLCPEFEKHGSCQKQRCPYPHGRMVRKYSVFSKNKFAKKSSEDKKPKKIDISETAQTCSKLDVAINSEFNLNARYYEKTNQAVPKDEASLVCDGKTDFRSRPKLGELPSFIGFEES